MQDYWPPRHTFKLLCSQGILLCKKLNNKQSGCMIFRLVRLTTLIIIDGKGISAVVKLSATHARI